MNKKTVAPEITPISNPSSEVRPRTRSFDVRNRTRIATRPPTPAQTTALKTPASAPIPADVTIASNAALREDWWDDESDRRTGSAAAVRSSSTYARYVSTSDIASDAHPARLLSP
jgi:hypothetical protein